MIKMKKVKNDIELDIVTGCIVSDNFIKKIERKINKTHFRSKFLGDIITWCIDYYQEYEKAPKKEIENIFKSRKKKLSAEKRKLIELYLSNLSKRYSKEKVFNEEFLYDRAIEHIRQRDLESLVERINSQLERRDVQKASRELVKFQVIHKETSRILNPFDKKEINKTFDLRPNMLMQFPDALGELIGPLEREWLVSFTAPEKRGKTWILIETAFQAIMQRRRVLFISFEMSETQVKNRIWSRLTGTSAKYIDKRFVLVPVLDCSKNQEGDCEHEEYNENDIALYDEDNIKPVFRKSMKYKPCVYCKEKRLKDYSADYWYEKVDTTKYSKKLVENKAAVIRKQYGDLFRVKCFPAFTANSRDIKQVLRELEVNEGYYTDVLITDYLDIAGKEQGDFSERGNIDATWKMAKNIAATNKLLHVTVDQSSKRTYDQDVTLYDTSEDKRKNAHVDVKIAINKSNVNEDENINNADNDIRILDVSMLAHRHRGINEAAAVMILQQLGVGQPLLECAWVKRKKKKK